MKVTQFTRDMLKALREERAKQRQEAQQPQLLHVEQK